LSPDALNASKATDVASIGSKLGPWHGYVPAREHFPAILRPRRWRLKLVTNSSLRSLIRMRYTAGSAI
jgi:hypothetical protein